MDARSPLAILLLAPAILAGSAAADKPGEAGEKPWNLVPGTRPVAEVDEDEGANDPCPGEPYDPGTIYHGVIDPASDDDWITFKCVAGDVLVAGTQADDGLPPVDTVLELYGPVCGTHLASDDDGGPGLYSRIEIVAPHTGRYFLEIESYEDQDTGHYVAYVTCAPPVVPPVHDTCAGALPIPRCTLFLDTGSTLAAGDDYDPLGAAGCACDGGGQCFAEVGRDVVYRLDLEAGDLVDVAYSNAADGAVYLVTDCADVPGSCVAGSDATGVGEMEQFQYLAPAAQSYFLVCDSFGAGTGGDYELVVTVTCPVRVDPDSWGRVKTLYR